MAHDALRMTLDEAEPAPFPPAELSHAFKIFRPVMPQDFIPGRIPDAGDHEPAARI